MPLIDIVIIVLLLFFIFAGFRSGLVKKVIGIICLVVALVVATKFSSDLGEILFEPIGITGRISFFLSFLVIVISITLTQSLFYKLLIKDLVDAVWNKVGGMVLGLIEGGLMISIALILMSIYLKIPSEETRGSSSFYKPLKNFAPMLFDQINTMLPESKDFYHHLLRSATENSKKGNKKH